MASYPPPPPSGYPPPPPGWDPRAERRYYRDQARAQRAAFRMQQQQMRYQMRSMRRGSVLGPILLITIGVVFLLIQTGRLDHNGFWGWYGHWWPLLLVCAGILVLAEWAFDQYMQRDPQRPQYRRSVGGGVVVLLLVFVVAGVFSSTAHQFPWGNPRMMGFHFDQDTMDQMFGDKHESDQNLDMAFAAGSSLTVVNPRGDVTINGTSDDGRIHIALHKQVYARTDSDADSKAQQLSPDVNTGGSEVSIKLPALDGAHADLVISVPATAETTVNTDHGDVHVASIKAPVRITANHGDIELSAITGLATVHMNNSGSSLSAHSMDGGVTIQGRAQDVTLTDITGPVNMSGDFFGTSHLEHINGAVRFHSSRTDLQFARLDGVTDISGSGISADQVLGPVVLTTSNRNVTLERLAGDIAVTNRNGAIEVTAAPTLGSITLENRNGTVRATLPDKAGFAVQATTRDGEIDTDFGLTTNSNDNSKSLTGRVGSGGPMIHISTSNGDISIRKGDIAPLPPTPPAPPKITLTPPAAPAVPDVAAPRTPKAPRAPHEPKPTEPTN